MTKRKSSWKQKCMTSSSLHSPSAVVIWIKKFYLQPNCLLSFVSLNKTTKEKKSNDTRLQLYFSYFFTFHALRVKRIRLRKKERKFLLMSSVSPFCLKQRKAFKLTRKKFQKNLKLLKACHCHISWTFLLKWILLHFFPSFFYLSLFPPLSPLFLTKRQRHEIVPMEFISQQFSLKING